MRPKNSDSLITASFASGSSKPWSMDAVVSIATPGSSMLSARVRDAAGQLVLGEHIARALDEARALGDHGDRPAVAQELADVLDGALGVAGEARHRGAGDADVVAILCRLVGLVADGFGRAGVERGERPPHPVARSMRGVLRAS